jgi:hypothetical protein
MVDELAEIRVAGGDILIVGRQSRCRRIVAHRVRQRFQSVAVSDEWLQLREQPAEPTELRSPLNTFKQTALKRMTVVTPLRGHDTPFFDVNTAGCGAQFYIGAELRRPAG